MLTFGKTLAIFDLEANGLSPSKIHCLTAAIYSKGQWRLKSTTDPSEMKKFFKSYDIYVGHNLQRWDIPVVNRLVFSEVETEEGYRIAVEEGLIKRGDECVDATLIDTLGLSWYLFPDMLKHGLEDWGEYFGVPKPKIKDWDNLTEEEYIHRCEEDVKINCKLWDKQLSYLLTLYDSEEDVFRLIKYLEFKLDCAREAEFSRWKLDVNRCKKSLKELEIKKAEKNEELKSIMPFVEKTSTMERPKSLYKKGKTYKKPKTYIKKDGSLSVSGEKFEGYCKMVGVNPEEVDEVYIPSKELTAQGMKWMDLLEGYDLPETHQEPLEYISSVKEPNPNSHTQMKDYLFSLGWKPETYNKVKKKDEDGDSYIDEIPQLRVDIGGEKQLCPSVKKLFKVEPKLEALEGLSIITHRMGILKGYLKALDDEGYVKAEIQGFTNTLRFKHKTVVNLPSVKKPYGDLVRGVLTASGEDYELCGSDMSSLEDRTKQHYMWEYDPEYVKKMMSPDFDPHIDIAVKAGFIDQTEGDFYKWWKRVSDDKEPHNDCEKKFKDLSEEEKNKEFKRIDKERSKGKTTNYAATYGAGGKKIAESADLPEKEGYKLHESYWDINWSITAISKDQLIKVLYYQGDTLTYKTYKGEDLMVDYKNDSREEKRAKYARIEDIESMWLFNPVSKLWYSLRYPKDIFSTLNQGTGVYCFDMWIYNFRKRRPQITGQFHDEVILHLLKGNRKACEKLLKTSVRKVNKQLSLNRDLDVDVQFGQNYAEIH